MKYLKLLLILLLVLTIGLFGIFKVKRSQISKSRPPIIEDSIGILHINCNFTSKDLLNGLTATDDIDGDLTDKILIGEFSPLKDGNMSTYNCVVFDSDGQYSEFNRIVTFDDYTYPRVYLKAPMTYYVNETKFETPRQLLYARDKLDGDVTNNIELSNSDLKYTEAGDYSIQVSVYNSFEDEVTYTLPIHVLERQSSLFITLSQYIVYCSIGSEFDPSVYIKETSNDLVAPQIPYHLDIKSGVHTHQQGVYEVEYTLSGSADTIPAKTYLIVIVQ